MRLGSTRKYRTLALCYGDEKGGWAGRVENALLQTLEPRSIVATHNTVLLSLPHMASSRLLNYFRLDRQQNARIHNRLEIFLQHRLGNPTATVLLQLAPLLDRKNIFLRKISFLYLSAYATLVTQFFSTDATDYFVGCPSPFIPSEILLGRTLA